MTLPFGTALQQGNYVLDAHCFDDLHGAVYLATHVPTGQVVLLRKLKLPSHLPTTIQDWQTQFDQTLQTLSPLQLPFIPSNLGVITEDDALYLKLPTDLGHPLSRLITPKTPWQLAPALNLVRAIAKALLRLSKNYWTSLSLDPNHIWLQTPISQTDTPKFILTGWLPTSADLSASQSEDQLCRQLAQLFYFMMTGEGSEDSRTPLVVRLRHQYPALPSAIITAVEQATLTSPAHATLQTWANLTIENVTTPSPTQAPPPPAEPLPIATSPAPALSQTAVSSSTSSKWLLWLTIVGLVGGGMGMGFGLTLRFQGTGTTAVRFNPKQGFPSLDDWSGDDPVAEFDAPYTPRDWSRDVWIPPSTPASRQPSPVEPTPYSPPAEVAPPPAVLDPAPSDRQPSSPSWESPSQDPVEVSTPAPPAASPEEAPPPLEAPAPLNPAPVVAPEPPASNLPVAPAPPVDSGSASTVSTPDSRVPVKQGNSTAIAPSPGDVSMSGATRSGSASLSSTSAETN